MAQLQRIMKRLYRELEDLRERNDSLAAALGACYLCWGEDPGCEFCAGAGTPGSNAPDEILLSHYVTPAIRRLRASPRARPAVFKRTFTEHTPGSSKKTAVNLNEEETHE
jgi:hypothetical protein